jgi:tRNA/tmRNA/rRNA uracil-C5-methylase (TrmA/RlmC/RlmD family)
MKSGGGSSAHVGMYVGEDWWTFLSTYDDHTPILDVTCGSATVSLSVADRKTGTAAVEFARDLADKAAKFAAEIERLHAQDHDGDSEACTACRSGRDGEAA